MIYYPAFLNLQGKNCLVIGQGPLVDSKAEDLSKTGALVLRRETFDESDLDGVWLIVADVDRREAQRISEASRKRQIFVNIVDKPSFCDFILPSISRRGDLTIALSTGGKSPSLAAKIRREFDRLYGPEYGEVLNVLGDTREWVKSQLPAYPDRHCFYLGLLELPLAETMASKGTEAVERLIREKVEEYKRALKD